MQLKLTDLTVKYTLQENKSGFFYVICLVTLIFILKQLNDFHYSFYL